MTTTKTETVRTYSGLQNLQRFLTDVMKIGKRGKVWSKRKQVAEVEAGQEKENENDKAKKMGRTTANTKTK